MHTHTHAHTYTHTHTHTLSLHCGYLHNLFYLHFTEMLKWFVDAKTVQAVLRKPRSCLIEEEQVEVHPENLPDAILDKNVDVHLIRQMPGSNPLYRCNICQHDLCESQSIVCDHCLSWFHTKCMGLKSVPKQVL